MTGGKYLNLIESSAINGGNSSYVEDLYELFLKDPTAVDGTWQAYFRMIQPVAGVGSQEQPHGPVRHRFRNLARMRHASAVAAGSQINAGQLNKQAAVLQLINGYRVYGHQAANLDPLNLVRGRRIPELDLGEYGLTEADLQVTFDTGTLCAEPRLSLHEIVDILDAVYTGTVGAQYMYIGDAAQKRWIQDRLEREPFLPRLSSEEQLDVLRQLIAAEGIERYLGNRYVGQKRFSLEGGDSLIPLLDELMRTSSQAGVDDLIIGMAHRGRLNMLVNVLGKAPSDLFAEFDAGYPVEHSARAGDVKYHMGFETDIKILGRRLHLGLAFNPSHLEIVGPVVEGAVKARQIRKKDDTGTRVLPILIHGDAAFSGQGVVMETLQLSCSKGYSTGGTVHVIVNNQIGFTTPNPIDVRCGKDARTSRYCTDAAKMLDAPVFHVNADDPEAVVFVTRIAVDFRNTFHKDVFVDLCCYRRQGHNEADEPSVTQPLMYEAIKNHPTTPTLYASCLEKAGIIGANTFSGMIEAYRDGLDRGENIARTTLDVADGRHTTNWANYTQGHWYDQVDTCVSRSLLETLATQMLKFPEGFSLHPRVERVMLDRKRMANGEIPMDWGFSETLAYASLVGEGFSVRLSGQDTRRGTFFHRHASVYDVQTGSTYTPLKHIDQDKDRFVVNDSLLSEEGVLGFEYGFSSTAPDTLVLWEAQFGDFANGAQVVIDQFIASGMVKWGRYCGLTLLLPHGYEGQGPEHSSARLERYLQLCAGDNIQVCVPSTPAQLFHMLRRQMKRTLRLPLVVMMPKSLLRHRLSVSNYADLNQQGLQLIIHDTEVPVDKVRRVVFCSGKIYYDLFEARAKAGRRDVALVRIEQLYPFPHVEYEKAISMFPRAHDVVWCQEEPENQGAWYQIKHRLRYYLDSRHRLLYATRRGSSTTAVGYFREHLREQQEVVSAGLNGGKLLQGGA